MAIRKPKLLGVFDVPTAGYRFEFERTDIGAPYGPVPGYILVGDYFMSGEGAADPDDGVGGGDLCYRLEQRVYEADAGGFGTEFDGFECGISSAGIVWMKMAAGQTATLTWTDTELRDQLGYEGATASLTDAELHGTLVADRSYWANVGVLADEPQDETTRASSRAINATTYVVNLGEFRRINFAVRVPGWWRVAGDALYHQLHNLFRDHMLLGERFRYYLDATATGEFSATNRYGYHVCTLGLEHDKWDIRPINRQSKVWYEGAWTFDVYVAP